MISLNIANYATGSNMIKGRVIIVGIARNVEDTLEDSLVALEKSFGSHFETEYFIVESDSLDSTKKVLEEIEEGALRVSHICLGNLQERIPDRISRIRFCRNEYVDFIRKNYKTREWDYVVVADLDGINSKLNSKKVKNLVEFNQQWDVLTCNQIGPYYDIYALRASGWVEYDCLVEVGDAIRNLKKVNDSKVKIAFVTNFLLKLKLNRIRKNLIYDKMRFIPSWSNPIRVESAFGGVALYKASIFLRYDYEKDSGTSQECEHVSLHRKIVDGNGQIFIVPSFTNCGWNEHSINKIWLVRFIRRVKGHIKLLLSSNGLLD